MTPLAPQDSIEAAMTAKDGYPRMKVPRMKLQGGLARKSPKGKLVAILVHSQIVSRGFHMSASPRDDENDQV
jgi:hypothetical protein